MLTTPRRAFTLVESLIVIVVIGILLTIALAVGKRVLLGGQHRATEQILKTLDVIITQYSSTTGGKVPTFFTADDGTAYPIVDARLPGVGAVAPVAGSLTQPSLALFLLEAQRLQLVDKMISGIDSQFIVRQPLLAYGWAANSNSMGTDPVFAIPPLDAPIVLDGFGNPIRFVHPAFHGGFGDYYKPQGSGGNSGPTNRPNLQVTAPITALRPNSAPAEFSRSCQPFPLTPTGGETSSEARIRFYSQGYRGDADEGRCLANRPYVYSCGVDGDPGTRVDNIYLPSGTPQWPAETSNLNLD